MDVFSINIILKAVCTCGKNTETRESLTTAQKIYVPYSWKGKTSEQLPVKSPHLWFQSSEQPFTFYFLVIQVKSQRSAVSSWQVDITGMNARRRYRTSTPLFIPSLSEQELKMYPIQRCPVSESQDQYPLINHYKKTGFHLSKQGRLTGNFMSDTIRLHNLHLPPAQKNKYLGQRTLNFDWIFAYIHRVIIPAFKHTHVKCRT